MVDKKSTYLALPPRVKRMAGMAAAKTGMGLSEYVADLITRDCKNNGVAALVADDNRDEEANDARDN